MSNVLNDTESHQMTKHEFTEDNAARGLPADYMCGCPKGELLGPCEHSPDFRRWTTVRDEQFWMDAGDMARLRSALDQEARDRHPFG